MADAGFGRGHRDAAGGIADHALHRAELDLVAERRRGAVRVDIVDVTYRNSGAFDRHAHAAERAVAVRRRCGNMVGIARQPVAGQLGIDPSAARLGMVERFQHHRAGALAHHEAVAVLVVGARGALRIVIEPGRQRAQRREAGQRNAIDRGFRAARHHHFGIAERHHARGVANGMGAGRAGGDHRVVGAFQAEFDGDEAGCEIDDAAGNEERRHPARPLFPQCDGHIGDALDAADAGADHHAGIGLIFVALRPPAGVVERLACRAHGVDDELVDLALLLRLHPLIGIEGAIAAVAARDAAGDLTGDIGDVEPVDSFGAALTLEQALPCRLHAASERR